MNQIQISFCDEDRARLDAVASGLAALIAELKSRPNCQACAESVAKAETSAAAAVADVHPVDMSTAPWEAPAPAPAPAAKPVSLPEFQKAITVRCAESPEVKEKVKALVNQYAESASGIPEGKRAEVLAKLAEIK